MKHSIEIKICQNATNCALRFNLQATQNNGNELLVFEKSKYYVSNKAE